MSYFIDGKKGRNQFIESNYEANVNEFWLKVGESKEVIFVDDAAIGVMMASVAVGPDQKKDRESFVVPGENSVLHDKKYKKKVSIGYREHYTILDMTPYVNKKNERKLYTKRILRVPKQIAELLDLKRRENGGDLTGLRFKVTRTGEKSANVGDVWDVVGRSDVNKLKATEKPLDYPKVLKPKSEDYYLRLLERTSAYQGGDDFSMNNDPFAVTSPAAPIDQFDPTGFVGGSNKPTDVDFGPEPNFSTDDQIPF